MFQLYVVKVVLWPSKDPPWLNFVEWLILDEILSNFEKGELHPALITILGEL